MVDQTQIEKLVIDGLRTVYDPEIPVNIHELGLIYGVAVEPSGINSSTPVFGLSFLMLASSHRLTFPR